jgi:hypothetical protein
MNDMTERFLSRRLLLAIGIWFAVLIIMCAPFHGSSVSAMPENLWTRARSYSWHSPVLSQEVLPFQRTEHGFIWHFLVVDRGQGHSHWSARIEPRSFLAYAFIATIISLLFVFLINLTSTRKTEN